MNDESFIGYVLNYASRYDIETLEKLVRGLNDHIASRRWGKPEGLAIGTNIEAIPFDTPSFVQYGTVVSMSPKGCKIEAPASQFTWPIWYARHSIRILDEYEWNRICGALERRDQEYEAKRKENAQESIDDREAAIKEREKARKKAVMMQTLNGPVEMFRGAFVHAYRPDWEVHEYGVVVHITPKKVILSDPGSEYESQLMPSKNEIELLDDQQWRIVDAELRRRGREYEAAKESGLESSVPDYAKIPIPLT